MSQFQSTRPIRGATPNIYDNSPKFEISIHAPHTGRDECKQLTAELKSISIHAPHTGRDGIVYSSQKRLYYFNPRAPYGARQDRFTAEPLATLISIHAPHTGRDSKNA